MKQINLNVSGVPTDTPLLRVDTQSAIHRGIFESDRRVIFQLPDSTPPHGAMITWANKAARFVIPVAPGSYEGGLLGLPTLDYLPVLARVRVAGPEFVDEFGQRWLWRGVTGFRLPQRMMAGENIGPWLEAVKAAGANLVRSVAMKANNTGWDLIPRARPDYFGDVRRFFDRLAAANFYCEWTVLVDTALIMPDAGEQQQFFTRTCEIVREYPFVFLELCNEWNHPTQRIDPQRFQKPAGIIASHGSGLTDADAVQPRWDFAGYHSRRDRDARGFTNYDPYTFQAEYPKAVPLLADEGAKPEDYGGNSDFAHRMGQHAACGVGGTFHSHAGIDARPFTDTERLCAEAFYRGLAGN